jgi:hypothetical protein
MPARPLAEFQDGFAAALLDPGAPVPSSVAGGEAAAVRFAVYRNNVHAGLTEALAARFPVTARLVGPDFFRAAIGRFIPAHLPRSPVLAEYGDDLPRFLDDFEPASSIPYLGDVARIEAAWSRAYHAEDRAPLPVDGLARLDPGRLAACWMALHPSVGLIRSAHPALSIWLAHQGDGEPEAPEYWAAEDAVVLRPGADVIAARLGPGEHELLAGLRAGASLEAAGGAAMAAAATFDLGRSLVRLAGLGAFLDLGTIPNWSQSDA